MCALFKLLRTDQVSSSPTHNHASLIPPLAVDGLVADYQDLRSSECEDWYHHFYQREVGVARSNRVGEQLKLR